MTIRDVARSMGVSDTMIRSIDKKYLQQKFCKPRLRDLEIIAIDEIYVGKKHKFFTIVIDWMTGAIVFVGDGKGEKALKPFWKRLRGSKARIKAVATDMASAYYSAVLKNIPNAKHVFDRFHIVKLMNEKLTTLRRDLQREAESIADDRLLSQRGSRSDLATTQQSHRWCVPRRLVCPRPGIRHQGPADDGQHSARTQDRDPQLVRLPHLDWPTRRHQQQDRCPPKNGLWLPRS